MKESDKWRSHISSKLRVIYISFNNGRHPVAKTFTPLHFTPLHYNFRHYTSSHLNFTKLHFTTLSLGLTPFKISYRSISPHITTHHLTSLQFTTLSLGLTPFQFPNAPFDLTSLHITSLHFTELLDYFRHPLYSFHFTPCIVAFLTYPL